MTIPSIDLNLSADDIGVGLTLKTKDGKTIVLDAFSVKEAEPEPARISLKDAAIGDKFEVRDGRVFTVKRFDYTDQTLMGEPKEGCSLWFYLDGRCLGCEEDLEVTSLTKAPIPRVSTEDAKKGDTFVLRNGMEFVCDDDSEVGRKRGKYQHSERTLWFLSSGRCPAWDDGYEVVEIIPAPKPTLSDRISSQLNQIDAKIDRIVVCYDDWKELSGKSDDDNAKTYFKGVTLRYGFSSKKGEFSLVFAAD